MNRLLLMFFFSFTAFTAFSSEKLINGTPVKPGQYPEILSVMSCQDNRCYSCTASIVGPRTIITAAHCLMPNDLISFRFNDQSMWAECESGPEDFDAAICQTRTTMKVRYAQVSRSGPERGESVTLTGYGCTSPERWSDGILRHGEAPVNGLPSSGYDWYWTVSTTALCFGDSGGPSYRRLISPETQVHYLLGINSRGDLIERSLMTATYLKKGIDWLEGYAIRENVKICGINITCTGG